MDRPIKHAKPRESKKKTPEEAHNLWLHKRGGEASRSVRPQEASVPQPHGNGPWAQWLREQMASPGQTLEAIYNKLEPQSRVACAQEQRQAREASVPQPHGNEPWAQWLREQMASPGQTLEAIYNKLEPQSRVACAQEQRQAREASVPQPHGNGDWARWMRKKMASPGQTLEAIYNKLEPRWQVAYAQEQRLAREAPVPASDRSADPANAHIKHVEALGPRGSNQELRHLGGYDSSGQGERKQPERLTGEQRAIDGQKDVLPSVSPQEAIWKFTESMLISNIKGEESILYAYRDKSGKYPELNQNAKQTYLSKIAEIGGNIDAVYCTPQMREGYNGKSLSTAEFLKAKPDGRYEGKVINFYQAHNKRLRRSRVEDKARLSLRITPSRATDVFAYVVSELVAKDPNVQTAKVASPYHIHIRYDSLIIYLCEDNEEKALNIAHDLWTKFGKEGCIGMSVPAGMKEMCPGIGYAEKLSNEKSYSNTIAAAVASAIDKYHKYKHTRRQGQESPEKLLKTKFLPQSFVKYGIDPEAPYKKIGNF